MKRYLAVAGLLVLGLFVSSWLDTSMAQEEETETKYASGIVKSISGNQIVVSEYDDEDEIEIDEKYLLDTNTKYENVDSQKDIAPGDYVGVDYVSKSGEKIIVLISVEKLAEEEEELIIEE